MHLERQPNEVRTRGLASSARMHGFGQDKLDGRLTCPLETGVVCVIREQNHLMGH